MNDYKLPIATTQRPSQVQRDYGRIIRGIGTPAPIPKPRGKSPGRQLGCKGGERPDHALIRKSVKGEESESLDQAMRKKTSCVKSKSKKPKIRYLRMQRIWSKNRSSPMRC